MFFHAAPAGQNAKGAAVAGRPPAGSAPPGARDGKPALRPA